MRKRLLCLSAALLSVLSLRFCYLAQFSSETSPPEPAAREKSTSVKAHVQSQPTVQPKAEHKPRPTEKPQLESKLESKLESTLESKLESKPVEKPQLASKLGSRLEGKLESKPEPQHELSTKVAPLPERRKPPTKEPQPQQGATSDAVWASPGRNITLHISTMAAGSRGLAQLPSLMALLKCCFAEVLVVFDLPHGGCNYGPVRLAGGPKAVASFLHGPGRTMLEAEASRVLEHARKLHARHCPAPLLARAEIMDYETEAMRQIWRNAFYLEFEPPTADQQRWPFAYMWKNTMAYVFGIVNATGEFVLHFDDDWGMRVANNTSAAPWLQPWISAFDADAELVFVQPCACGENCRRPWMQDYKEVRGAKFLRGPPERKFKSGSYVSLQVYLTKQSRFAKLYPLPYWRHFTESVFQVGVGQNGLTSAFADSRELCKADFRDCMKDTGLTESQKAEASLAAPKTISVEASHEHFDLNAPHGRCKFR